jgi:hypothetical protein
MEETMDDNNQQGQQQGYADKGSGHRGDQGEQSHDTSRLEREGHEFPRTSESAQSNNPQNQQHEHSVEGQGYGRDTGQSQLQGERQGMEENDSLGQHQGDFDDAGQGDPIKQRQAPTGSPAVEESHDSWRPTADPAAGDLPTGSEGQGS